MMLPLTYSPSKWLSFKGKRERESCVMLRFKIKNKKILKKKILSLQKKGAKIVFTNGCFDLLHAGHVTYLEKAKKLGTHLIVALNSDVSVQKLKGKGRPINILAARMAVVAALESVDFVTWFSEETPLQIIQSLMPDVLVKGGDYPAHLIVGGKETKARGGRVARVPFLAGFSTTALLKKRR